MHGWVCQVGWCAGDFLFFGGGRGISWCLTRRQAPAVCAALPLVLHPPGPATHLHLPSPHPLPRSELCKLSVLEGLPALAEVEASGYGEYATAGLPLSVRRLDLQVRQVVLRFPLR